MPQRPTEPNRWLVLVIVCLAQFMVVLDATIVNVALPSIQHDLGFSDADLQWVDQRVHARLRRLPAARRPRRRPARPQAAVPRRRRVFSAASLLNGLAQSSEMLIAGRALQGLGGALVSPAALSIITTTFAGGRGAHQGARRLERDRRGRRRVRPAARRRPHRPALVGVDLLRQRAGRHRRDRARAPLSSPSRATRARTRAFDVAGAFTVTAGLMVLVYAIVKAQEFGWGSARTLGLVAVAARAARRLRGDRAPHARRRSSGWASSACARSTGANVGDDARRRGHVRDVLLRVAVRAGRARLQPAEGRPRVPAGHARDHGRRRASPSS